jgi:hypothetical protein
MSDSTEVQNANTNSLRKDALIAIDIQGKSPEIWAHQEPRFYQRLLNSMKRMVGRGNDIPPRATADEEIKDTLDTILSSAQEKLKGPALANLEKQANVAVKLAEAKEREANARRLSLEADKLEMEIEREKVHESQRVIDLMIQRGELLVTERDGVRYFIYNSKG